MNKWFIGIPCALVGIAIGISLMIQQRTTAKLRDRNLSFQRQADQLTRWSTENNRLSNLVDLVHSSGLLSKEQLLELLRLRNEAGQLREAGTEKEQLQTANVQLRDAKTRSEQKLAEARALPNFWPRDQLSFAGFADPASAVRTFLWYMNNGDFKNGDFNSWRSVCTPEAWNKLQSEWDARHSSPEQRIAEMQSMAHDLVAPSEGFHILNLKMTSPNEATVNLSFDGEGKTRKFVVRKVGDEWKFHDIIFAGLDEPDSR